MKLRQLVKKSRSKRRFREGLSVSMRIIESLVDMARYAPSGANLQPLRYILCNDRARNDDICGCLAWAGYLKDWPGPAEGERPSAYIVILGDKDTARDFALDAGIAAQTIMLGAVEAGLGGCVVGSIDRNLLRDTLGIARRYEIVLVLALGVPMEKTVVTAVRTGSIRYWRDAKGVHHVPKRSLAGIVVAKIGR